MGETGSCSNQHSDSVRGGKFGLVDRLGYLIDTDYPLGVPLLRALRRCGTILDVGVGRPRYSWIRRLDKLKLHRGVGLDIYLPYLSGWSRYGYWRDYVRASALRLPFRDLAFDASFALDVIEHLTKSDGDLLIRELKRVSSQRVILLTPNGFLPQDADDNPAQRHLSGWSCSDLEFRGFTVSGIRGWKTLRREYATPTIRPLPLGLLLSTLTEPAARFFPKHAFQLLAVWNR